MTKTIQNLKSKIKILFIKVEIFFNWSVAK